MSIVGVAGAREAEKVIALGRYIVDPATNMAEVDFAVHKDWQDMGVGTYLLTYLIEIAHSRRITGFKADVLPENHRMLHTFHKSGFRIHSSLKEGLYKIRFKIDDSYNPAVKSSE
jgi:GNAT superfamily N-acetyltransferase